MNANGSGPPTFVSILEDQDGEIVWLHAQMPGGPLLRGPYADLEEAQRAAAALERVARRRWAQHGSGPGDSGGRTGEPAPLTWTTVDRGKESARQSGHDAENPRFPRILAHFLRDST